VLGDACAPLATQTVAARRSRVADRRASVVDGMPDEPTTTLTTDSSLFVRLVAGRRDPIAALEAGLVTVGGDVALGERVVAALPYTI